MKIAVRAFLALALVPIGLFWVAPAGAQDPVKGPRTLLEVEDQDPGLPGTQLVFPAYDPKHPKREGYCDFPAYATITRNDEYFIQSIAPDGTTTVKWAGYLSVTVTNRDTGKSVPYQIPGPGVYVFYPDGSFSLDVQGPNLLWTTRQNSFPGVPMLNYTQGHVTVEVAASGKTTAYDLDGRSTDVCAVLASP